jgi:hypothetical protein
MKDFTTRVETTDQELHIHLPEGFGPGAYQVVVTPVQEVLSPQENRLSLEDWGVFVKSLDLTAPPNDWKFDREESNQRGDA